MFEDSDDPTVALITELLKTGGNDGQALVNAISSNYDTANEAKTRADEVAESVMGLTGDEGAVSMNTTRSMQNATDIGMNTSDIAALGNRVGANESAIQRNSGMISDLNESLEVVRAGVAASMALAGMPAINGRGIVGDQRPRHRRRDEFGRGDRRLRRRGLPVLSP